MAGCARLIGTLAALGTLLSTPLARAAEAAPPAVAPAVAPASDTPAGPETSALVVGPFDPAAPATWRLAAKLPAGNPAREALVRDLSAKAATSWEQPLTREEAEALLDDPRAQPVYAEKTISIVAPSMLTRQRQGHVDLLKKFLAPERIEAGAKFAEEHRARLEAAEQRHGVAKEVIVSILMWESRLGTITGDFVAFNSFTSQAFFIDEANAVALAADQEKQLLDPEKQPARVERIRARARANLVVLVRSCKARGIDPLTVKGSWAGALGFPQFMPASLRWAEDGNGDGKIDLFTFEDAIASIANYLKKHGWAEGREKAVWGYNHEDAYVKGVLGFADALAERLAAPAKKAKAPGGTPEAAAPAAVPAAARP